MDHSRFKAQKIVMQRAQMNNCPIAAVKTTLYMDTKTGKKLFVNEFHNKSNQKVESFSVRISCFDENVNLIGTIKDYRYKEVSGFVPGSDFGQEKLIACPSEQIVSFAVAVTQVELEGNCYWDETVKMIINRDQEQDVLVEMAPDFEAVLEESTSSTSSVTSDTKGNESVVTNVNSIIENPITSSEVNSATLFSDAVLPETLEEDLFGLEASEEELGVDNKAEEIVVTVETEDSNVKTSVEKAEEVVEENKASQPESALQSAPVEEVKAEPQSEPQDTAVVDIKVEAQVVTATETKEESQLEKISESTAESNTGDTPQPEVAEEVASVKKKFRVPKTVKGVVGFAIVAGLLYVAFTFWQKYNQYSNYNRGAELMANGQYEYAISCYSRLGNYMDSPTLLVEAKRCYADSLRINGNFKDSIKVYEELGGFQDMVDVCYDEWALSYCKDSNYEEAYNIMLEHEDSLKEETKKLIKYQIALTKYSQKQYDEVLELLKDVKYGDSDQVVKETYYELATAEFQEKNYDQAETYFSKIAGFKDVDNKVLSLYYAQGKESYEDNEYEKALEYFLKCEDYNDTADYLMNVYYQLGLENERTENYGKATEYFSHVLDNRDVKEHYDNCLYQKILRDVSESVTAETMELFDQLPKDYTAAATLKKMLAKYVDHVGEYEWTTSNDKEINAQGGFEEHLFVNLSYANETITFTLTDDSNTYPIDQKTFAYKSGTESNSYSMLNTTTITRTYNGKIHTYKKVKKD